MLRHMRKRQTFASAAQQGFTLLELLMTVAILAIVLTVGIPSFAETIRNNRLASGANELRASLALARSEAAKRGVQVSICPRSGNACADSLEWSTGWLVFLDEVAPTGTIDGSDAVLQTSATRDTPIQITSTQKSVTFTPTGVRTKTDFTVTDPKCKGTNKRAMTVELTGRVSLKKQAC
jgi:type IV fimbrial biogenesis protein FimT